MSHSSRHRRPLRESNGCWSGSRVRPGDQSKDLEDTRFLMLFEYVSGEFRTSQELSQSFMEMVGFHVLAVVYMSIDITRSYTDSHAVHQ